MTTASVGRSVSRSPERRSSRRCRWCGDEFVPAYRQHGLFCCKEHAEMMQNPPRIIEKTCQWCCEKFQLTLGYGSPPSSVPNQKYCSKQCKKIFENPTLVPQTAIVFCRCGKVEPLFRSCKRRKTCKRCTKVKAGAGNRVRNEVGRFGDMSQELFDAATNLVLGRTLKVRVKDVLREQRL